MTISITKMELGKNKYLLEMPTEEAQEFREFFKLFNGLDEPEDWYTWGEQYSLFCFDKRLLPTVWLLVAKYFPGQHQISDDYAEFYEALKEQQDMIYRDLV